MTYEQARKKAKKFHNLKAKDKPLQRNLVNSIINQARLHEGESAAIEINKELYKSDNCSQPRHGWSKHYEKRYEEIFKKV